MEDKAIKLTPEQRHAVEARGASIVLSAGAGCGKTFVLTSRYLSHLDRQGGHPLDALTAITFTERAAREMRERIRRACLRRLVRCEDEEADHWTGIVRRLESARISTIHSFCAALLRSHAVEARLDPRFVVLEETTTATLLDGAVRDTLNSLLAHRDDDAMHLVLAYGLSGVRRRLSWLVRDRYRIDFAKWDRKRAADVARGWRELLHGAIFRQVLARFADEFARSGLAALLRAHRFDNAVMEDRRQWLLEHIPALPKADQPEQELRRALGQAQIKGGGSRRQWPSEQLYDDVKKGLEKLRKAIKALADVVESDEQADCEAADLGLRFVRLAHKAADAYEQAKAFAGAVDFDDLLIYARNLLRDIPGLRRRAADRVQLLMVDEFQDTDPVQVELVRLLCGDRLLDGKLFVVGDYKQSIYRFRGADPHVFLDLQEQVPERGRLPLTVNFRSQPAILDFVNALFVRAMGSNYEPLRAHRKQIGADPAVELMLCPAEADGEGVGMRRRREAVWIAARIRGLLDGKEELVAERDSESGGESLRRPRPGDIAVLFRALSDVQLYEQALRDQDVPYYLVGGHAFYAQQEIYDLANLLGAVENRDDAVRLIGALRSPFFSLSDETLFWLAGNDGDVASGLRDSSRLVHLDAEQRRRVDRAACVLDELAAVKDRLPLTRLIQRALELTGYDAALVCEFLGRRKLANLHKLIDLARQFDRAGFLTLADFLEQLEEYVAEQPREPLAAIFPEHSNVVRLMTIHQAKGLEFPIVFVPDLDRAQRSQSSPILFDPELGPLVRSPLLDEKRKNSLGWALYKLREESEDEAELLRLLYVATTRAADRLVLSASIGKTQEGEDGRREPRPESLWLRHLASRFDLETGECTADLPGDWRRPRLQITSDEVEGMPLSAGGSSRLKNLGKVAAQVRSERRPGGLPPSILPVPLSKAGKRQLSVSELLAGAAQPVDSGPSSEPTSSRPSGSPRAQDVERLRRADPEERSYPGFADEAALRGSVVHAVLQRVDLRRPGDVGHLLVRCAGEHDWKCGHGDIADMRRMVEGFLGSPIGRMLSEADPCYREVEFLLRWPPDGSGPVKRFLRGFIDCLYRHKDGWHLLDYKTNRIEPAAAGACAEGYVPQMVVYAMAAERVVGKPLHSAHLFFLDPGVAWELKLSDKRRRAALAQLEAAANAPAC